MILTRAQTRDRLSEVADTKPTPDQALFRDSYGNTARMFCSQGGNIGLSITGPNGVATLTMVGVGGGDHRPHIKEALRLLMHAIEIDG